MKHLLGARQLKAGMITQAGPAPVTVDSVMKAGLSVRRLQQLDGTRTASVRGADRDTAEPPHPLVDVVVLQLNKAGADCSDVALLIREGNAAGSLWIFELRVCVDAGVTNPPVQSVHYHSQLHWRGRGGRKLLFYSRKPSHNTRCRYFLL